MGVDGMLFNAPATAERIAGLLDRLQIPQGGRVLDIGCGRGEMLAMLAETHAAVGTGLDPDPAEIAIARARTPSRGQLIWHGARFEDVALESECDAVICIGAAHAFGHLPEALPAAFGQMRSLLRERGRILIGLGYWRHPPPQAYLDATGIEARELLSHEENIATGRAAGLKFIHAETGSTQEWDAFEGGFLCAAERRLAEAPDDEAAITRAAHWRMWNAAYQRWGRTTMGFGFYIFER